MRSLVDRVVGSWMVVMLVPAMLAGCTTGAGSAADGAPVPPQGASVEAASVEGPSVEEVSGEVVVSAAASLTEAFTEIAAMFEAAHPGATVTLNFAGSQTLAAQIVQGAPVDVFASANQAQMDVVAQEGLASTPQPFATNELAIAVEPGNPAGVSTLADLADPDLLVVLAATDVPAGAAAVDILDRAGVEVMPASLEPDVRAALSKVELGEADAAVVYRSDIQARGAAVEGVDIGPEHNITVEYPITVLTEAPNPAAAQAFVALVLSAEGQEALQGRGFGGAP